MVKGLSHVLAALTLYTSACLFSPGAMGQELSNTDKEELRPRFAKLQSFDTKFFTLETDGDALFAKELSAQLDAFAEQVRKHFKTLFNRELPIPRLTLTVFEDRKDYIQHTEIHAPQLTSNGGYYDGALKKVVSHRYNTNIALYFHELIHGMMGELFDDHHFYRYTHEEWPVWFDEGLAEYLSYSPEKQTDPGITHPGKYAVLYNALMEDNLPKLATVLQARADSFSGPEMNMNYAVAWGFLAFLTDTRGNTESLQKYLELLLDGKGGSEAFKTAFDSSPLNLEEDWRAWLMEQSLKPELRESLLTSPPHNEWTIHEGGDWRFDAQEVRALSSGEYDYLIRNLMPFGDFRFQVEVKFLSGKAGLILGNNRNGSYPYEYLIDFTRKSMGIRKSESANKLAAVGEKLPPLPTQEWHRIVLEVVGEELTLMVNGEVKSAVKVGPSLFSLIGLYVHNGETLFRKPTLLRGPLPKPRKKR